MKITILPEYTGKLNYTNNWKCPIAKALRKKGILALVGPYKYHGLFLGIIPVWGEIPVGLADRAHELASEKITEKEVYNIGLFN